MIDDEEVCLMSMELLLSDSNYELIKANSGKFGLNYLKKYYQEIDIILLDWMIPDLQGLEILKEIKDNKKLSHIPVIMQTGVNEDKELAKARKLGVAATIKKPYQKLMVLASLEKAVS